MTRFSFFHKIFIRWSISGTCDTMKKKLSIWSAPLLEGFRKPAYRLEPTAGFLMPPFYTSLAIPCNCVIMKIQMVLSGDGQPHSSIWKEIRLLLEAGGGFLYARIATMITKRITKKVKKSYFVIGHHPISGARFDRLPYRQHRVQYNISAWNPATEAHPQKSPVKGPFITAFDRGFGAGAASGICFFTIYGNFIAQGVQPFAPMVRP